MIGTPYTERGEWHSTGRESGGGGSFFLMGGMDVFLMDECLERLSNTLSSSSRFKKKNLKKQRGIDGQLREIARELSV